MRRFRLLESAAGVVLVNWDAGDLSVQLLSYRKSRRDPRVKDVDGEY